MSGPPSKKLAFVRLLKFWRAECDPYHHTSGTTERGILLRLSGNPFLAARHSFRLACANGVSAPSFDRTRRLNTRRRGLDNRRLGLRILRDQIQEYAAI